MRIHNSSVDPIFSFNSVNFIHNRKSFSYDYNILYTVESGNIEKRSTKNINCVHIFAHYVFPSPTTVFYLNFILSKILSLFSRKRKAGSGGRQCMWFKLTSKSWITVWPNRETTRHLVIRLPVPYMFVRRIFPDSEMRKSDFLSLLRKGKQDRKWADYRARAQSRQRQVECTRKNLSWNSFLRAITPAGLSFTTAKLLQTRKALGVEYYLQRFLNAQFCVKEVLEKNYIATCHIISFIIY